MRIVFFPQSCLPFHAHSLAERPLGGVETGIIRLAQALHDRGHEVIIYTSHPAPPPSTPPYLPLRETAALKPCDAFISVREWFPLISQIPCRKRFLWTGDNHEQIQTFGLGDRRVVKAIDGLLTVGRWQAETLCAVSGFPREKTFVLGNGLHLPLFAGTEDRHPKRLIYSSTPFRGLNLLPAIFMKLKERHPSLELAVFSGFKVYADQHGQYNPAIEQQYEALLSQLRSLPGVTVPGNVQQSQLARELMRARVLAYPNTYQETCCITAMEAQAAGCPIVSSALAGLPDTVGNAGVLLREAPDSPAYRDKFIAAVDRLLSDDDYFNTLSLNGLRRAQSMSWDSTALRLEQYLCQQQGLPP